MAAAGGALSGSFLALVVLSIQFVVLSGESVLGEINADFDFDGLPGVQHEFKVDIAAGKEECFYQRAAIGAKLHVSFEVLRGGDRNVDVILRDSNWQVINAHYWKNQGLIEADIVREDTYAICIDNTFGRFASKLVYIYLVSFVMAEWSKYAQEIGEIHLLADNFTHSLSNVQLSVQTMLKSQSQSRFNVVRDWYLIYNNNKYIQNWSIAQCLVIVSTAALQVYFVRRLFRTTNVTPTAKPRA